MFSATLVVKAMTSWLSVRSSSLHRSRLKAARGLHLLQILAAAPALGAKRLAGEQFDLQPDFQLALFAPDLPHFGA